MDTIVTITVMSDSEKTAEKSIDAAFLEIERLEKMTDFFSPDSEISKVNKNAGISAANVSRDLLELIDKALFVSEKTDGAFDVTIGPVISLYDFHKKKKPEDSEIKEKLSLVNYRDLITDRNNSSVYLKRKGMLIDLGGIAKGYAADKAAETLKKNGIQGGLVAVAGDIRAFGSKPDGNPWKIGIRNPRGIDGDEVMATLELKDMAISTSGDYERFFIIANKRYHHLLNPRTGYPAGECRSVSIITKEGAFTDAFATGIFVLGPSKGMTVLKNMGYDGLIIDNKGNIYTTFDIRGKIEFTATP